MRVAFFNRLPVRLAGMILVLGFVTVAGVVMGIAALLLTFVETWDSLLVAAVLFGVGFGAYRVEDKLQHRRALCVRLRVSAYGFEERLRSPRGST